MPTPPLAPAERLATLLLWLSKAVDSRGLVGLLARPLVVLILDRLRAINQRFARLAARIAAGTFAPRRSSPRTPAKPSPRAKSPLPSGYAWLIKLVPEAAAYGAQLQALLAEPEMAALLEAAPAPLRRPIRSLCRMLAVQPPPILANPPCTRPKKPPKPRFRLPEREKGFSARYPAGRPRYICGLRAPWPLQETS
jgi:hypothetical protein